MNVYNFNLTGAQYFRLTCRLLTRIHSMVSLRVSTPHGGEGKHGFVQAANWHWDLFMDIAIAKRTGNRSLSNDTGDSDGTSAIRGNMTISLLNFPVFKNISGDPSDGQTCAVAQARWMRKLRRRIIDGPIFNRKLCSGIADTFEEFKHSVGKCTATFSSTMCRLIF